MTRRDDGRAVTDYPEEVQEGAQIVGIEGQGSVVYWDPVREVLLDGEVNPEGDFSRLQVREELGLNESLVDRIREIEHSVGWQDLSAFAEDLLDGETDGEGGSESQE